MSAPPARTHTHPRPPTHTHTHTHTHTRAHGTPSESATAAACSSSSDLNVVSRRRRPVGPCSFTPKTAAAAGGIRTSWTYLAGPSCRTHRPYPDSRPISNRCPPSNPTQRTHTHTAAAACQLLCAEVNGRSFTMADGHRDLPRRWTWSPTASASRPTARCSRTRPASSSSASPVRRNASFSLRRNAFIFTAVSLCALPAKALTAFLLQGPTGSTRSTSCSTRAGQHSASSSGPRPPRHRCSWRARCQTSQHGPPSSTMALITSDRGTTRYPGQRMALITSGCVPRQIANHDELMSNFFAQVAPKNHPKQHTAPGCLV